MFSILRFRSQANLVRSIAIKCCFSCSREGEADSPSQRPISTGVNGENINTSDIPLTHLSPPVRSQAGQNGFPARVTPLHRKIWRVRGIPDGFDKARLATILQEHHYLRPSRGGIGNNVCRVRTLAPDLRGGQVATIRFRQIPAKLRELKQSDQLTIDADIPPGSTQGQPSFQTIRLTIDQHFHGITVLFAPSARRHCIDLLAVPGLGGHPFGSFVDKGSGHMWLSDSLPQDMAGARVMVYGYESALQDSASFANLGDLANSLRLGLRRVLGSGRPKCLILIGHSLGGLLIKEALVRMADSYSDLALMKQVFGAVFFGVPNDGMEIESLIPMVNDQPNRFLLESLSAINSQVLGLQARSFATFLNRTAFEIFCFYEVKKSRTAAQVSSNPPLETQTCKVTVR